MGGKGIIREHERDGNSLGHGDAIGRQDARGLVRHRVKIPADVSFATLPSNCLFLTSSLKGVVSRRRRKKQSPQGGGPSIRIALGGGLEAALRKAYGVILETRRGSSDSFLLICSESDASELGRSTHTLWIVCLLQNARSHKFGIPSVRRNLWLQPRSSDLSGAPRLVEF